MILISFFKENCLIAEFPLKNYTTHNPQERSTNQRSHGNVYCSKKAWKKTCYWHNPDLNYFYVFDILNLQFLYIIRHTWLEVNCLMKKYIISKFLML